MVGTAAWLGVLATGWTRTWLLVAALGTGVVLVHVVRRRGRRAAVTALAALLVGGAAACAALLQQAAVVTSPVAALAQERAAVSLSGRVVSDPRPVRSPYGEQVLVRLRVDHVHGRGAAHDVRSPVLVLGEAAGGGWSDVRLGERVRTSGRLAPADDPDLAGLLTGARPPERVSSPDPWWTGAAAVRASIRDAVRERPADQRALVPALVVGDDAALDPQLADDFRATGLTHLLAVSGTNLTLVVGFLLVLARWCGVRGRWNHLVGAVGIIGFVLLARTEPSVLRAAVMGAVALLALGVGGRRRAVRGLGVAVTVLLLVQPALATSAGFALSVLATAGIVVLAPGLRDAMSRWLPRWLAEAVAVPTAAQLACTPVVAAISGEVSLVAVAANLLVAPVVGPATVLGLAGGLVGLVADPVGAALGFLAGACVAWIITVARTGAGLPAAAVSWGSDPVSLLVLSGLCAALMLLLPLLLRSRRRGLTVAALMVLAVVVRPPALGWPADGWVMAMCDVGQGDALVIRAAPDAAVVVDTGPEPEAVDACLDRLGVEVVPLLVLTHFHADHVDGLAGVLAGREVGVVEVSPVLDPSGGVEEVGRTAAAAGVPVRTAVQGTTRRIGSVTLQNLYPGDSAVRTPPGDGSSANDGSIVLLIDVDGLRLLLTGDLEPPGQAALARLLPDVDVDVLKVPHHGSRFQDVDVLASFRAEVALVSAGVDNDYGHPSPELVETLTASGSEVWRTDEHGDVLVLEGREVVAR